LNLHVRLYTFAGRSGYAFSRYVVTGDHVAGRFYIQRYRTRITPHHTYIYLPVHRSDLHLPLTPPPIYLVTVAHTGWTHLVTFTRTVTLPSRLRLFHVPQLRYRFTTFVTHTGYSGYAFVVGCLCLFTTTRYRVTVYLPRWIPFGSPVTPFILPFATTLRYPVVLTRTPTRDLCGYLYGVPRWILHTARYVPVTRLHGYYVDVFLRSQVAATLRLHTAGTTDHPISPHT